MSNGKGNAMELRDATKGLRKLTSIPAFASYIEAFAVPDSTELNVRLIADILSWRDAHEGETSSNHRGWHSTRDIFSRSEASFAELAVHIRARTESC